MCIRDRRKTIREEHPGEVGGGPVRGKDRHLRGEVCVCRSAGSCACTLIINKEEEFLQKGYGSSQTASKLILSENWPRDSRTIVEEIIRIQDIVSEKLECVTMIVTCTGLESYLD